MVVNSWCPRSNLISIHALREEGDMDCCSHWLRCRISIHALREEGDKLRSATLSSRSVFLSTPSARRATRAEQIWDEVPKISIHALREEGDPPVLGVRLFSSLFLSTPSARRDRKSVV